MIDQTTFVNIFGDGGKLMGEKLGFVSVMAVFRNAVFTKLLLGETEYAKQFERKGRAPRSYP